jgi:3-hydroxyisobutyrate dehydrogenase-like beta-hydroxyacid dehydrogenase
MAEVVGFLGLGDMGGPMSANLVQAGYEVRGYDPDQARLEQAVAAGVRPAESCAEAARSADQILVSIVRTLPQSLEALFGPDSVASAQRPGLHVVVMSTVDPGAMIQIAADIEHRGMEVVDAPVSGGTMGAEAGSLSIMLAGKPDVISRTRPVLEAMGSNLFVFGERPGMAQAAKLANQMMLGVSMLGTFEGLSLALEHGVDEEQLISMLSVSTGNSWPVQNWEHVRGFWEGYAPGGALDIIYKDLRAALVEGAERQLELPVTAVAMQRLRHVWRKR